MNTLYFSRVSLAVSAHTLLASLSPRNEEGNEARETLAGTNFYAEAFLTESGRDAALGQVPGHLEFVAASAAEVAAVEYPTENLAIGPKLSSPEFGPVSSIILPAVLECELNCSGDTDLQLDVTVNRVQYLIAMTRDGQLQSTSCYPLHHQQVGEEHWRTAHWLADYFASSLRGRASDWGNVARVNTESIGQSSDGGL